MNRDAIDAPTGDGEDDLRDWRRLPSTRSLAPRGPKKFVVEQVGNGIRCIVTDWSHESIATTGTGATSYNVYWAETVDMTTDAGVAAGFARAILLAPAIPAPGSEDQQATCFYGDPKYLTGYFYCVGVDPDGDQSDPTTPVHIQTGGGGAIPSDVEHFQASESGEQHDQTTISAVSYSFRIPDDGGDIDHVQFFYLNYPVLNETAEGESVRVTAGRGGTQVGKLMLPRAIRTGAGTISIVGTTVTGIGTAFHAMATIFGGDQLEVFGVRARIASVTNATTMTLSSAWAGPTVTNVADFVVIGSVTLYAVSEGLTGARRDDIENAPSVTLDLDGELSAPNAPSVAAIPVGTDIRIEITPPDGTQIARILLYRATGAGVTFSKSTCRMLNPFEIDNVNPTKTLQWDDSDFTAYERESGQTFSYFATAVNVRGGESAASTRVEASAKLASDQDTDPVQSRDGFKNLLFDGFIGGTGVNVGGTPNVVDDSDASQDAFNFNPAVAPSTFTVASATTLNAWTFWKYSQTGGATVYPTHINGNEVKLPAPGAGKAVAIKQRILAWNDGTQANRKILKGGYYTLQVEAYSDGSPNGSLQLEVAQVAAGVETAALVRERQSSDAFTEVSGNKIFAATTVLSTAGRYYANVRLDPAIATDSIIIYIAHSDSTSGNLYVRKAMLNEGIKLAPWTGDMGQVTSSHPVGSNPGTGAGSGDPDGHINGGRLQV